MSQHWNRQAERWLAEATASVDATTESRIKLGLREAMKGRTTIIIAHRLSTISLADEIIVLDGGRVAARGTHDQLVSYDFNGVPVPAEQARLNPGHQHLDTAGEPDAIARSHVRRRNSCP